MRCLRNMIAIVPSDSIENQKTTEAADIMNGSVYIRFTRE